MSRVIRYILTDIEGTTTSVAFVYDTLFPYFKQHITDFLREKDGPARVAESLQAVQQTLQEEGNSLLAPDDLARQLIAWTDADRKHPALKAIQGVVWRAAYERGEIKGHLYADVLPVLAGWQQAGLGLGVYSSGSVEAQRLLFTHSVFGDVSTYFTHYFDTGVGLKRETASYQTIANALQLPPANILFLSDVEAELDAAAGIGMPTIQLLRPGTEASQRHPTAADFFAINKVLESDKHAFK